VVLFPALMNLLYAKKRNIQQFRIFLQRFRYVFTVNIYYSIVVSSAADSEYVKKICAFWVVYKILGFLILCSTTNTELTVPQTENIE
jgi:hypothetical protein